MSNPSVIILIDLPTKSGGSFRVEDNIGESIHIHYNNFRIDLTFKEFLYFSDFVEKSFINLINCDSFNIENFDPKFLKDISHTLVDLESVAFEDIRLSDLIVSRKSILGIPKWVNLKQSRVYRAINGDMRENNDYVQENYFNQSNQGRVEQVNNLVNTDGYPFNDEYIVLFNDQNFIRDGQHRASALLANKGDIQVPIIRMNFENNKHNVKENLFLHSFMPIMKGNIKNIARKIINRIREYK